MDFLLCEYEFDMIIETIVIMNEMNKILDTYNLAVGGIVTLLAAIFGK